MKTVGRIWYYVVAGAAGFAMLVGIDLATAVISAGLSIGVTYVLFLCGLDRLLARVVGRRASGWLAPLFAVLIVALIHMRYLLGIQK